MYRKIHPIIRQRHEITVPLLWQIVIISFVIVILLIILVFDYAGLCGKFLLRNVYGEACEAYENKLLSEPYCEELCSRKETLTDIQCVQESPNAITAVRNRQAIVLHYPDGPSQSLSCPTGRLTVEYPKGSEFYNILKMHFLINYNVTLKDKKSIFPYIEAIDEYNYKQMESYWTLFNWNDYVMFKLFEDDEIFPKILGNCGPFFITQRLILREDNEDYEVLRERQYFLKLLEYVLRLEAIKPDPLKICNINLYDFGLTKNLRYARLQAQNAKFIKLESQLDKLLANGNNCKTDEDCKWYDCLGVCDPEKRICNVAQKHNNLKLLCDYVREHPTDFPELIDEPLEFDLRLYTRHCSPWNAPMTTTEAIDIAN